MPIALSHPLHYQTELDRWKDRCEKRQKEYGDRYKGKPFLSFDCSQEKNRIQLKDMIAIALFGHRYADCNSVHQRDASEFVNFIYSLYEKKTKATVKLTTILVPSIIFCGEATFPIFSLFLDRKTVYIDHSKKVYNSFDEWKENNSLPSIKSYPKNGSYYSHPDELQFENFPMGPTSSRQALTELANSSLFFTGSELNPQITILYQYVLEYKSRMRSESSRSALDRFIKNCGTGMEGLKKSCKLLSMINNPEYIFGALELVSNISIDGSREDALLISTDLTANIPTTLLINQTTFTPFYYSEHPMYKISLLLKDHPEFTRDKLKIDKLASYEAFKLKTALFTTCHRIPSLIEAVVRISKKLDVNSITDFCAVAEIVNLYKPPPEVDITPKTAEEKKNPRFKEMKGAEFLVSQEDLLNKFVEQIVRDRKEVKELSKGADYPFESALTGLYHFRKHGWEDFKLDSIRQYLRDLPRLLFIPENLRDVTIQDDRIVEKYVAPEAPNEVKDTLGVLLKLGPPPAPTKKQHQKRHKPFITTMYRYEDCLLEYNDKLTESSANNSFTAPSYPSIESLEE